MSDKPKPDLLDNIIQRTDNAFNDVRDDSLIGQDLPEEDEDEGEYGEDELPPERSQDPKTL